MKAINHFPIPILKVTATLACLVFLQSHSLAQEQIPVGTAAAGTVPVAPAKPVARNRVISIMPTDKRPLLLKGNERNPFARRNPDVDLITEDVNQETEADLIRDILNSLPITGRSYGPKGLRVLAGEIIFERGKMVDQVIENQTENLIVEAITQDTIELAWIDMETGKLTGKRLSMTYDLTPRVRYVLKGQSAQTGEGSTEPKFGFMRPDDDEAPTADQIAVDQLPNDISAEAFSVGQ
ncbi:MAG: hypothetical protein KDN20_26720 [Verrucomicrobiae bacterium]|nr:hypothetical protein [Verrucomicrobiae bacterium]